MVKVSVIIPVYNVENYIEECLKSVLNQSLKEIEIILVNDGSLDKSEEICRMFLERDNRIKLLCKENRGLSSARNLGIEVSKGKYISFVDSDDIINSKMLEILYNECEINNADIAQCKYERFASKNEINFKIENYNSKIISKNMALNNLYNSNYINATVAWNKLYKRNLFSNLRFPEGKIHEDEFTTYKALYKSNKVVMIDSKLYYYRNNPYSIVRSKYNMKRLDSIEAFEQRYEFFKEVNLIDLQIKTLIKYSKNILSIYYRVYYEIDDNSKILNKLKKKYKKYYIDILNNKNIDFKFKIISSIFVLCPSLYVKYIDLKRVKYND